MSDTDKSNQISISDIIQDIDHKPTKDWLEENAEEIQETFDGVQKDINEINGLIDSYNTIVVNNKGLEQNSLPYFDEKFTSDNIRGVFSNFTDGSGFGITFDDIASQTIDGGTGGLGELGDIAADLGAGAGVIDDGKESQRQEARQLLSKIGGRLRTLESKADQMSDLNRRYLGAAMQIEDLLTVKGAKEWAAKHSTWGISKEIFDLEEIDKERKERLRGISEEGLGAMVPTENALGTVFQEQCFLQAKVHDIVKYRRDHYNGPENKRLPYVSSPTNVNANSSILVEGQAFACINKLTQAKEFATMFDLSSEILSQLQPMVRLYKVDQTTANEEEIEIKFPITDSRAKVTDAFKNKSSRGIGVGLSSFNYSYEGSDPFSLKKSIKATLVIHATSFDELLSPRGSTGKKYSYADLALKTGSELMEQNINSNPNMRSVVLDNINKLKFRLKAVVGYQVPPNLALGREKGNKESVLKAIYDSYTTLNLTPTIHEFDFDESGRVTFTINYLAYIEDFFDDALFNIFSIPEFIKSEPDFPSIYSRKLELKKLERNCEFEKVKELKEDKEYEKAKHIQAMQSVLKPLFTKNLIRYLELSYTDLLSFNLQGSGYDLTRNLQIGSLDAAGDIEVKREVDEAIDASADGKSTSDVFGLRDAGGEQFRQISFFFFSDLLDSIMENMDVSLRDAYGDEVNRLLQRKVIDKDIARSEIKRIYRSYENFKKMRVVLGPMELHDQNNPGNTMVASIGDIPISVKFFIEWMTSKLLSKNFFTYSLSSFINEFIKNYLRNFLNNDECFGGAERQRIQFFSSALTSYANPATGNKNITDEITEKIQLSNTGQRLNIDKVDSRHFPILNIMGSRGNNAPTMSPSQEMNYMIFYAGRSQPQDLMTGNLLKDRSNGINHYILGKDRGIVKNIQLQKTTSPNLRTVRFEQEGYDGFQQLREVYDATVDTFLAPNTFPGTYIFIDPRGFAPNSKEFTGSKKFDKFEISQYGVGGYYMIIKSEHSISAAGVRETKIIAKWVAQLEKERRINNNSKEKSKIENNPDLTATQKCKLKKKLQSSSNDRSAPKDTVATGPK